MNPTYLIADDPVDTIDNCKQLVDLLAVLELPDEEVISQTAAFAYQQLVHYLGDCLSHAAQQLREERRGNCLQAVK